jgi:hypothetical protein
MKALLDFLNSNFGVLISGAVISGLFVQYITSTWQQRVEWWDCRLRAQRSAVVIGSALIPARVGLGVEARGKPSNS